MVVVKDSTRIRSCPNAERAMRQNVQTESLQKNGMNGKRKKSNAVREMIQDACSQHGGANSHDQHVSGDGPTSGELNRSGANVTARRQVEKRYQNLQIGWLAGSRMEKQKTQNKGFQATVKSCTI